MAKKAKLIKAVALPIKWSTATGKVVKYTYKTKEKKKMNFDELTQQAKADIKTLTKTHKSKTTMYQLSVNFGTIEKPLWIATQFHYGDEFTAASLYQMIEDGEISGKTTGTLNTNDISEFKIYAADYGLARGGNSKYNDCLYKCLSSALGDKCPWTKAKSLKEYLSLNRCDKVGLDELPMIEKKLKSIGYHINVIGVDSEHSYSSQTNKGLPITLSLNDEHYEFHETKTKDDKLTFGVSDKERKPLIYRKLNKDEFEVYDGITVSKITKDNYKILKNRPYGTDYILVACEEQLKYEDSDDYYKPTLKQSYDYFIKMADELKEATKDFKKELQINLYITGEYTTTASKLFEVFVKHIIPDDIDTIEAQWIEDASFGAVLYSEDGYIGPAFNYDVNSHYPSIMSSVHFQIPIRKPEYKMLTELPEVLACGIYKCVISHEPGVFFRYNAKNTYTNIDINSAKKKGLKVELIQNGFNNACVYVGKNVKMTGSQLFKDFVEQLYALKLAKVKGSKRILTCLWGYLSMMSTMKVVINESDEEGYELYEGNKIKHIIPVDDEHDTIIHTKRKAFRFPYARMKPFMLAKGREKILNICDKYMDDIVRIHTDGFYVKRKIDDIKLGTELGELKYEGFCPVYHVNNVIHCTGKFN